MNSNKYLEQEKNCKWKKCDISELIVYELIERAQGEGRARKIRNTKKKTKIFKEYCLRRQSMRYNHYPFQGEFRSTKTHTFSL